MILKSTDYPALDNVPVTPLLAAFESICSIIQKPPRGWGGFHHIAEMKLKLLRSVILTE